jgi:formyl-CoA transferase
MAKMLEGFKVLDFTINAAGPIVGSYFADYGADVVKIEPAGGEAGRKFAHFINGISTYSVGKDRGKRSIEMDLKDPVAIELIKANLHEYDVVINSFKPGVMDKLGLGYEDLKAVKPDIIYGSLSAFGSQPSKYMNKPAYDICAAAMSGVVDQTGEPDGNPTRIGSVISDMSGAEAFFAAVLLALLHHQRTGEGQFIDVSLLRNMIHLNAAAVP